MKTRDQVDKLKWNWFEDPIWDLAETEGFEEYKDELIAFRDGCEASWHKDRERKEQAIREVQYDRRIAEALERIAAVLEACYSPENKAFNTLELR